MCVRLNSSTSSILLTQNISLVTFVQLFQEDEGQHCVWPQAEVIGSETFP